MPLIQHMVFGCNLGAFNGSDANGTPITEVLAKNIRAYLPMITDYKTASL